MKKILSTLLLTCLTLYGYSQCDYYAIENGSEWEMETYNAKGKLGTRNIQKVTSYNSMAGGFKATIHSIAQNDKGKELMKGDLEMKCENGTLYMDMRNFVTEDQFKALGSYETKVESSSLEIPSKLSVGQSLKDGSITVTAVGAPMTMQMSVSITDRKVEAKESMTTPAGTFECFVITSKMTMQNKMGINMTFNFTSKEWVASKVGTVRSESYDKNGKLNGYTILTKRK